MEERKLVELFTDGACSGNPGPGGWGAVLRYKGVEKELSGGEASTTNNRMELTAAIRGLQALREPCRVLLTSDSKYLVDGVEKGWVYNWKRKGWHPGAPMMAWPTGRLVISSSSTTKPSRICSDTPRFCTADR